LLSQAGVIRRLLASKAQDAEERRALLHEALQRMRQAMTEGGLAEPAPLTMLAETALELGWLPGSPPSRRELFTEACDCFAKVVAANAADLPALRDWASALAGRAAVAGGDGQRKFLERAEEKLAAVARLSPPASEPHLDASKIWLRLAGESSAAAREGAVRAAAAARRANAIEPGAGDYLLACALSRLGEIADSAEALTSALARDPGRTAAALNDPHLEALRAARPGLFG
jgi:tetratricopeptide (TPR) repeat protein